MEDFAQKVTGEEYLHQHATRDRSLGFAACCLASMFWGCGFFFGKIALAEMNSGAMVLYRFLFAALGLIPFLLTHRPGLNRREWLILLFASRRKSRSSSSTSSTASQHHRLARRSWSERCP